MSAKKLSNNLRTWVEIDRSAVHANVRAFRKLVGSQVSLWAVVKSNAYGHGIMAFSPLADAAGVDGFCVDSIVEGLRLREIGIRKPILVLGPTLPERFAEAAVADIALSISTLEGLRALAKIPVPPRFHIKIDTGMHRQGLYRDDLPKAFRLLRSGRGRLGQQLAGVFTHYAASYDATDAKYTNMQRAEFERVLAMFKDASYTNLIRHVSATGGSLLGSKHYYDAVRVGIGLYGLWPSPELERQLSRRIRLHPVLSWRTVIAEVKRFSFGDRIGYDLTEQAQKPTIAIVLPIGYWHGYFRSLSSKGHVLVRGRRAKVLGRVSMDMIVVDITPPRGARAPRVGDVVTLIGRDGRMEISAGELAELAETSHYELVTRLNPLMERIVTK